MFNSYDLFTFLNIANAEHFKQFGLLLKPHTKPEHVSDSIQIVKDACFHQNGKKKKKHNVIGFRNSKFELN